MRRPWAPDNDAVIKSKKTEPSAVPPGVVKQSSVVVAVASNVADFCSQSSGTVCRAEMSKPSHPPTLTASWRMLADVFVAPRSHVLNSTKSTKMRKKARTVNGTRNNQTHARFKNQHVNGTRRSGHVSGTRST